MDIMDGLRGVLVVGAIFIMLLSFHDIYPLIPLIIIVILILAAVGMTRGASIFAFLGFDSLVGLTAGTGGGRVGKTSGHGYTRNVKGEQTSPRISMGVAQKVKGKMKASSAKRAATKAESTAEAYRSKLGMTRDKFDSLYRKNGEAGGSLIDKKGTIKDLKRRYLEQSAKNGLSKSDINKNLDIINEQAKGLRKSMMKTPTTKMGTMGVGSGFSVKSNYMNSAKTYQSYGNKYVADLAGVMIASNQMLGNKGVNAAGLTPEQVNMLKEEKKKVNSKGKRISAGLFGESHSINKNARKLLKYQDERLKKAYGPDYAKRGQDLRVTSRVKAIYSELGKKGQFDEGKFNNMNEKDKAKFYKGALDEHNKFVEKEASSRSNDEANILMLSFLSGKGITSTRADYKKSKSGMTPDQLKQFNIETRRNFNAKLSNMNKFEANAKMREITNKSNSVAQKYKDSQNKKIEKGLMPDAVKKGSQKDKDLYRSYQKFDLERGANLESLSNHMYTGLNSDARAFNNDIDNYTNYGVRNSLTSMMAVAALGPASLLFLHGGMKGPKTGAALYDQTRVIKPGLKSNTSPLPPPVDNKPKIERSIPLDKHGNIMYYKNGNMIVYYHVVINGKKVRFANKSEKKSLLDWEITHGGNKELNTYFREDLAKGIRTLDEVTIGSHTNLSASAAQVEYILGTRKLASGNYPKRQVVVMHNSKKYGHGVVTKPRARHWRYTNDPDLLKKLEVASSANAFNLSLYKNPKAKTLGGGNKPPVGDSMFIISVQKLAINYGKNKVELEKAMNNAAKNMRNKYNNGKP